ncbi:hypothetical protein GJ744_000086 [Endocarpon pusillum]|uniref:Uncharacterized protein n=1 Tax=Endocarpon pusillum TaxID=364733 RepID=A0A8H7EC15_9EURO|nr:hypothetical protein GJ744_000086 [Endocarpon pusillum]
MDHAALRRQVVVTDTTAIGKTYFIKNSKDSEAGLSMGEVRLRPRSSIQIETKKKPQETMCQLSITYHGSCPHVTIKPLTTCRPLCPEPCWTEGPRRDLCAACMKRREQEIGRKRKDKMVEKMAAAGVGDEADGDVWEEIEL